MVDSELHAAHEHAKSRQAEVRQLRDAKARLAIEAQQAQQEKAAVEADAVSFNQRMESAVASFTGIIEQGAEDKALLEEQPIAARRTAGAGSEHLEERRLRRWQRSRR